MKRSILLLVLIMIGISTSFAQLRKIKNETFIRGEYLKYKVYYESILSGQIIAGDAELQIKKENKVIGGRNTYHVVGLGMSHGVINRFFKVVDRYETYIDEEAIVPWLFIRRVSEGSYKVSQDITFNQNKAIATSNTAIKKVPNNIQDIISALYYARTLDITDAKLGSEYKVDFFLDDSVTTSKIKYMGKETITIGLGTFKCVKFKPMVATGKVFKDEYPMTLYVTDDKNHIPILAEAAILVGKVKMELITCNGLANPVTSRVK